MAENKFLQNLMKLTHNVLDYKYNFFLNSILDNTQ